MAVSVAEERNPQFAGGDADRPLTSIDVATGRGRQAGPCRLVLLSPPSALRFPAVKFHETRADNDETNGPASLSATGGQLRSAECRRHLLVSPVSSSRCCDGSRVSLLARQSFPIFVREFSSTCPSLPLLRFRPHCHSQLSSARFCHDGCRSLTRCPFIFSPSL